MVLDGVWLSDTDMPGQDCLRCSGVTRRLAQGRSTVKEGPGLITQTLGPCGSVGSISDPPLLQLESRFPLQTMTAAQFEAEMMKQSEGNSGCDAGPSGLLA